MPKRIVSLLLAGIIIAMPSYAEEVYKRVDENGVPSFSDTNSKDAEKIIVEPVTVQSVPTPAIETPSTLTAPVDEAGFRYTKLSIISPENDSTLRDQHKILIQVALEPGLQKSHKIEFLDNGKPLQPASQSASLELLNFERGSHNLSARILDKNGKTLKTSSPVTVHVFRTVVKPPPAAPAKNSN